MSLARKKICFCCIANRLSWQKLNIQSLQFTEAKNSQLQQEVSINVERTTPRFPSLEEGLKLDILTGLHRIAKSHQQTTFTQTAEQIWMIFF